MIVLIDRSDPGPNVIRWMYLTVTVPNDRKKSVWQASTLENNVEDLEKQLFNYHPFYLSVFDKIQIQEF